MSCWVLLAIGLLIGAFIVPAAGFVRASIEGEDA